MSNYKSNPILARILVIAIQCALIYSNLAKSGSNSQFNRISGFELAKCRQKS